MHTIFLYPASLKFFHLSPLANFFTKSPTPPPRFQMVPALRLRTFADGTNTFSKLNGSQKYIILEMCNLCI